MPDSELGGLDAVPAFVRYESVDVVNLVKEKNVGEVSTVQSVAVPPTREKSAERLTTCQRRPNVRQIAG
jgi:hypothetical protein